MEAYVNKWFLSGEPSEFYSSKIDTQTGTRYFYIKTKGDCMNSPDSPIQVRGGDLLLAHEVSFGEKHLLSLPGKVVVLMFRDKTSIFKEVVFVDLSSGRIKLKCFNPLKEFWVSLDHVEGLFVVDGAYREEDVIPTITTKPTRGKIQKRVETDKTDKTDTW